MIKFKHVCLAVLCLFVMGAGMSLAAEPAAVLLYTANSLGQYQACPTCGQRAVGGLDRRATVLDRQRAASENVFTVSGGFDLSSYIKKWSPKDGQLEALVKAYTALDYDLGVLDPGDQAYLSHSGAKAPEGFVGAGNAPIVRILTKGTVRLGVVICPARKVDAPTPDSQHMAQVAEAAAQLRKDSDIVVAISTWGSRGEAALLKAHPGAVDALLGSGPGTGAGTRIMSGGATLWVRPDFEGRSVMRLDLSSFLGAGRWDEGTVTAEMLSLDYHVKGDGRISALFAWI